MCIQTFLKTVFFSTPRQTNHAHILLVLRNFGAVSLRALPGEDTGFIKGEGMEGTVGWLVVGESMGHALKMLKNRN